MHPVFVQTIYYGILMVITIGMVGFIQNGFFWKYFKVRMSFGRLILVKIKAINRDFFAVAKIEENMLVFKVHGEQKRISIKDSKPFYRCLATSWVDVDDEKNAVLNPDYTATEGFDAVKHNNLYLRALYKPSLNTTKEKLIVAGIIIIAIGVAIALILGWGNYANSQQILLKIGKGVVTPGVI